MDSMVKVKMADGTFREMKYGELCKDLGFSAGVHFVRITSRKTVSFTVGKPQEVRALVAACRQKGYAVAKAAERSIR